MGRMKHFVLAVMLIVCAGLGISVAQNINRALQLSQDPLGAMGVDTNNNVYFPNKLMTRAPQAPTLAGCGTGATVVGSDYSGTITEGTTNVTSCQMSFNQAYNSAPSCVVQARTFTTTSPISRAMFSTGIIVTHVGAATSLVYDYFCSGR